MRTVGRITLADLDEMKRRGMRPKRAFDATVSEAKARYPREDITIIKAAAHDGFDIIAL